MAVRKTVWQFVQRQSRVRRPMAVLIQGETGTGKGLLARAIHHAGPRADCPFVDINCAAIPETLLESELFGYERGAFTDARQAKPGLFQTAHHGTIFLDEIGLLPEGLQAKLLKVIEDQAVRRLGSTRTEPVDAWIMAATGEDLAAATPERRFRSDLYHRLAAFTISLPPLRERGEDIIRLAEHFLARACADYGLPAKTLTPEARASLLRHPWPGNVRELSNILERSAVLSEETRVTAEMLGLSEASVPARREIAPEREPSSLEDVMRDHLREVLKGTGWNLSRAAALLAISRNTLSARIAKYGLRPDGRPSRSRPDRRREPSPPQATGPRPETPSVAPLRWEWRRVALLKVALTRHQQGSEFPGGGRLLQALAEKVQSFGGQLRGVSPTSIVAAFGLEPIEDAAVRAAHAAAAMLKAAHRAREADGRPPGVSVGIHVTQALVGQAGDRFELDMDAEHQALTLLGALVSSLEPDTIAVSEAAVPFLERRIPLAPLDQGPAGRAHRVMTGTPAGFRAGGQIVPFVGRAQEMEILRSQLALAREGRGQVVGIVGEPGIGKSRLLYEFRQTLREEPITYLEAHCLSYGMDVPFLPVIELLGNACGLADSDTPETVRKKVRESLARLGLGADGALPYVLQLLGIQEGTESLAELTPEAINHRSLETLRKMSLLSSRQCPLIISIEDVHWIDESSAMYLTSLAESLAGAAILLVVSFRPGHQPPAMQRSYATQIALSALSVEDSLRVARSGAGADRISDVVVETILQKAEGNPFFIEELTQAVAGRGDGHTTVPVPDSVQAVLLARIDQLPAGARRLLQAAAVIGRKIPLSLLTSIQENAEHIDGDLRELTRLEFLYELAAEEPLYVFKHALTQDVAYASLSVSDRQSLHVATGGALERIYAGRLSVICDRLAYHYSRTTEADKAVDYLVSLADKATRVHAHVEAASALEQALVHAERLSVEERHRRRLDIVLRLAHSLYFLGRIRERLELLLGHHESFEASKEPALTADYHLLLGMTYSMLSDRARATQHGRRALEEATRAGDDTSMGRAHYVLAHEEYWAGRLARGVEHGRQAVALLEGKGEPWWLGMAHWILGVIYGFMGEFDAALETEARARTLGESIGDLRLQSYADWAIGGAYAVTGRHEAGLEACRRGLELSTDPVSEANALGFLGGAYLESGNAAEAVPLLEQSVRLFDQFRMAELGGWFSALLAEAYLLRGDLAKAGDTAEHGLALAQASGYWVGIGYGQRALGRIARARGALSEAERHLTDAYRTFKSHGALHWVGRTLLTLAELAHAEQNRDAITAYLNEAHDLFETLKVPAYVEQTERLAAEMAGSLKETS